MIEQHLIDILLRMLKKVAITTFCFHCACNSAETCLIERICTSNAELQLHAFLQKHVFMHVFMHAFISEAFFKKRLCSKIFCKIQRKTPLPQNTSGRLLLLMIVYHSEAAACTYVKTFVQPDVLLKTGAKINYSGIFQYTKRNYF